MSRLYIDTPYLVFDTHDTQNDAPLSATDREIGVLRELGARYAEIASSPVNGERAREWQRLNDLGDTRPLIWMNEICWNEMNVEDELTLRTTGEVCQRIETHLRRTIYQWNHMQGDMVVEALITSPLILVNSGFGIRIQADVLETEKGREIASRHFHNQFETDDDIEKIKDPMVEVNQARTLAFHQFHARIFEGILPVETRGCTGFWFAPWDEIVFWMNADNVLLGLVDRPQFMHRLISPLTDAFLKGLDQFESRHLLARNDTNVRIGSGGYGYTGALPVQGRSAAPVAPIDLWGSSTAQIFGSVSPAMHKEFGIDYETRWLRRFGLAYYGCCEPLHDKIGILEAIPNLRKISISPWARVEPAAELMRGKYVMSLKPRPAILAGSTFHGEEVRTELRSRLEAARGCNVEIILKDISTVGHEPWRLWEWTRIATEAAREFA
jgi:hypothetical protein